MRFFPKLASCLGAIGVVHLAAFAQPAPILVPGFLRFDVYTNILGTAVLDLTSSPSYPDSPGRTFHARSFDSRTVYSDDSHQNFGGRLLGFITPIETADYEFFLRSDDASQLFISFDDDPDGLELIAEETTSGGPFEETGAPETSPPRALQAGQRYAIQALYKEGGGGDLCQVAWRKVGDTTPAAQLQPIPGAFISALIPPSGSVAITKQPTNAMAGENEFVTLSVEYTATHAPVVVQWQRNGTNVPGLTGGTIKYGPLVTADNGARLRAVVSIPGAFTNSAQATLTVTPDVTRPTIKSVQSIDTFDMLTVEFSEAVLDSAGDNLNYTLSGGVDVVAAMILSPTMVRLTTSAQTPATTYTLTLAEIVDTAGNPSAPGTSLTFTTLGRVRGGLKFEVYFNLGGNAVSDLTSRSQLSE